MTTPTPLPTTRAQLLEALAAAETNLAIARREADTAWDNYDDACELRALDMASNEDLVFAESKAKDLDQLYFKAYQQVDEIKAQLLEIDRNRAEAARNRRLYPLTVDEQAALNAAKAENAARTHARLDDLTLEIETTENLLPQFSSVYSVTSLTERQTAKHLAAGCLARRYLNNAETDRPLFFANGGTDEAGGRGTGRRWKKYSSITRRGRSRSR